MHCLRCGTEVGDSEVFCASCLETISKDPVSRETPVVIQPHPEFTPMRSRPAKPEELLEQSARRIKKQHQTIWVLWCIIILLILALVFSIRYNRRRPVIGQNYTTVEETNSSSDDPDQTVYGFDAFDQNTDFSSNDT